MTHITKQNRFFPFFSSTFDICNNIAPTFLLLFAEKTVQQTEKRLGGFPRGDTLIELGAEVGKNILSGGDFWRRVILFPVAMAFEFVDVNIGVIGVLGRHPCGLFVSPSVQVSVQAR